MEQITASELKSQLLNGKDIVIIDVRESWEYEEQQLHPSSKNYPLGNLPQFLGQLSDMRETTFIVHCKTGVRSNQAQKYLIKNGFTKVVNLIGGFDSFIAL